MFPAASLWDLDLARDALQALVATVPVCPEHAAELYRDVYAVSPELRMVDDPVAVDFSSYQVKRKRAVFV